MNKRTSTNKRYSYRARSVKPTARKTYRKSASSKKKFHFIFVWTLVVVNVILIASLLQKILSPNRPPRVGAAVITEDALKVEVLNGCGVTGLANLFSEYVREKQYNVVNVGDAETYDYQRSVLIDRGKRERKQIEKLSKTLGIALDRILLIESRNSEADVSLIIGADYQSLRALRIVR